MSSGDYCQSCEDLDRKLTNAETRRTVLLDQKIAAEAEVERLRAALESQTEHSVCLQRLVGALCRHIKGEPLGINLELESKAPHMYSVARAALAEKKEGI